MVHTSPQRIPLPPDVQAGLRILYTVFHIHENVDIIEYRIDDIVTETRFVFNFLKGQGYILVQRCPDRPFRIWGSLPVASGHESVIRCFNGSYKPDRALPEFIEFEISIPDGPFPHLRKAFAVAQSAPSTTAQDPT